jgi:hypothetical protein
MSLPGFNNVVTIKRVSQTGHSLAGDPIVALSTVWVGKGHYQPETRDSVSQLYTDTGQAAEARYWFFIPYLTGEKEPTMTDLIEADGYQYQIDEIRREGLKHHLVLGAKRVDR